MTTVENGKKATTRQELDENLTEYHEHMADLTSLVITQFDKAESNTTFSLTFDESKTFFLSLDRGEKYLKPVMPGKFF